MSFEDNNDSYASSSDGSTHSYPPLDPVPTFIGFSPRKFTSENRLQFINSQLLLAKSEFNFDPTPVEREALSYYHGRFFNEEARGTLTGSAIGALLGSVVAFRRKTPWNFVRNITNKLKLAERHALIFTQATQVAFSVQIGNTIGGLVTGVGSFNKMQADMNVDPNLQRYLYMRRQFFTERKKLIDSGRGAEVRKQLMVDAVEAKQKAMSGKTVQSDNPDDDQSLGGLDFYDEPQAETPAPQTSPAQLRAQAIQAARNRVPAPGAAPTRDDDPFAVDDASPTQQPAGSAWDRLRRGEKPIAASPLEKPTKSSEDRFSFESDKEAARARAQEEFDERMERERRGEYVDSFVDDKGGRR